MKFLRKIANISEIDLDANRILSNFEQLNQYVLCSIRFFYSHFPLKDKIEHTLLGTYL